jgi:hypothetical protein
MSQTLDDGDDRVRLGSLSAKETAAHGEVHKQVTYFDRRAFRVGGE